MNTTPSSEPVQPGQSRRGFLASMAAALAIVPACAIAAAPLPEPEPAFDLQQYNRETMAHLLLTVELMREWFRAHEDGIREFYSNQAGAECYDLFVEGLISARQLQRATGLQPDQAYIRQFSQRCAATAQGAFA